MGNAEALHQARVALRRLRSAYSLFKRLLPGAEPQRLNGRAPLAWPECLERRATQMFCWPRRRTS